MSTAQALGSLIKSARDIMRKDKGLNGDLDRLPLLTWIMFLKFLDDLEQQREEEAQLGRKKFRPAIEESYRWRDWAANPQALPATNFLPSLIRMRLGARMASAHPACSLI
jgi:type I restriction enzyme M protein